MAARHHRRATQAQGLTLPAPWRSDLAWLFAPQRLNWWIGSLFAIGSVCFAAASALQLWPVKGAPWTASQINWTYFVGSIPFTTAGGLQLMQSAHAPAEPNTNGPGRMPFPGLKPRNLGWLSAALQFVGTLLFNLNTYAGALAGLEPQMEMYWVWLPNFVGSVFFLLSGILAYMEAVPQWLRLEPRSLTWWVVAINLLGCTGFMISAFASYVPPGAQAWLATLATATTFQGALCFLLGALLSLAESAHEAKPQTTLSA